MNRKIRSILFLSLAVTFLIAAPSAVFYSQGYRLDFQNLRVVQTGSFYFRVVPRSVEITIVPEREGALQRKSDTDFLFGTSYVDNLIPDRYNVTVEKEGYHFWRKTLSITERRVTEMKNLVLIPTDPGLNLVGGKTTNIFPLPYRSEMAIKQSLNENDWRIILHHPENQSEKLLISSQDINDEPINIISFPGKKELILDMETYYLVVNPEKSGEFFIIENIESPILHPQEANKVIILDDGNLISYDYVNNTSSIIAEEVKIFSVREDGTIFWLSTEGFIFRNGQRLRIVPFPLMEIGEYDFFLPNRSEIVIRENGTFYFLSDNSSFQEMFRSPRKPITSPDQRKVAYFDNHEIQILYLDDITDQPIKQYGESSFLTRFSGEIGNVYWLTNHYLIFNVGDEIKIMEIDDRDHINIVDLTSLTDPIIHFERSNNRLYILSDSNLFVSRKLIP